MPNQGQSLKASLLILLCVTLGGCAHNDVLVFGTDTKLGLDIETAASQGASPALTIGYKRKEAVWTPLVVNAKDSRVIPCKRSTSGPCDDTTSQWPMDDAKYRSEIRTYRPDGSLESVRLETYAVLASLGANIKGNAGGNAAGGGGASVGAGVGIAQFFATGGAATSLAQNTALVTALKIDTPSAAESQAKAVAVSAFSDDPSKIEALASMFSPNAGEATPAIVPAAESTSDQLIACVTKDNTWRWPEVAKTLTPASGLSAEAIKNMQDAKDAAALRTATGASDLRLTTALAAAKSTLGC